MEAHWRKMVVKKEAVHIQETKQDAEDQWVKWHLCVCCEALQTGKTEAEVMDTAFKKPMEHKKIRVQHYQECLEKKHRSGRPRPASGGERQILGQPKPGARRRSCSVRTLRRCFPRAKHLPWWQRM